MARYCSPSRMGSDGLPTSDAFKNRLNESYLSVNWLEYFGRTDIESAIEDVRGAFAGKRYRLSSNGRFAVLNVYEAKNAAAAAVEPLRLQIDIRHSPTTDDPSHAGIFGYGEDELLDLRLAVELRRLVSVEHVFLAVKESDQNPLP